MRTGLVMVVLLTGLLTATCGSPPARREYTLQGQILSVTPDHTEAQIKHEAITGFMAAMTMTYKVRDAREFADVKPGDLITSTLVVVSDGAFLEHVRTVGETPLERGPSSAPAPSASSGFELLRPGEVVPNATFIDQDGVRREFAALHESPLLVTFIYTSCPLPTFCPLMDKHFAAIQSAIKTDPALQHVRLVSISFDPLTDTPAVLKRHAATLGADPARWTFLTGDRDEVDRFASRFGVAITREVNNPRDIAHNLRTALIDTTGRLVKAYTGNEWTPAQALADMSTLLRANKS